MSKITLTDLSNLQNENTAVNAINTNNSVIELAFNNTLSLDGTAPNQMQADLDMNSNDILNLPAPSSQFSPIRLIDAGTLGSGGTITVNPLPAGGTTDQVLGKVDNTNFNTSWRSPVKTGGATGQMLGKNSATDGDVDWKNPVATGGTTGQILKKASGTNFDTTWVDATGAVAAGNGITVSGTSPAVINVRDFISVKDYGALGDGLHDDAPAFRAAVSAAVSGTTILIPPGRYLMNSTSNGAVIDLIGTAGNKSVSFQGMGWCIKNGGSYATPTGSVIVLGNSLTSSHNFIHYQGNDVVFGVSYKDFAIVTPSSAFGAACSDIIYIDATASDNFYLDHFTVENLFICNSASGYSLKTKANATGAGAIAYAVITNNQMSNTWFERVGDSVLISSNILGQNATLDARNIGVYFSNCNGATSTRIQNNVISNFSGGIICDGGVQPLICGNEFETSAGSTNFLGSVVNLRGTSSTIYGAVVRDNSWAQLSAVADYPCLKIGDVGVIQSAIIEGNRFDTTTGHTHIFIGNQSLGTFVGNNYWSIATVNTYSPTITNNGAYTSYRTVPFAIGLPGITDGAIGTLQSPANASGLSWVLPATSDTLSGKATTDIFTNKTFDTAGTGNVFKINGTTITAKTGTGSAVLATTPTLVTPVLGAATATTIAFSPTTGGIIGTATNDSTTAGNVGEVIEAAVASGSAVALVTATAKNVTSISLTAGDWEISGAVYYFTAAGTSVTSKAAGISTTTNTMDFATVGRWAFNTFGAVVPGGVVGLSEVIPPTRVSLTTTTTHFLVAQSAFTVAGLSAYGIIHARRVR